MSIQNWLKKYVCGTPSNMKMVKLCNFIYLSPHFLNCFFKLFWSFDTKTNTNSNNWTLSELGPGSIVKISQPDYTCWSTIFIVHPCTLKFELTAMFTKQIDKLKKWPTFSNHSYVKLSRLHKGVRFFWLLKGVRFFWLVLLVWLV